jgi:hypothetical protein
MNEVNESVVESSESVDQGAVDAVSDGSDAVAVAVDAPVEVVAQKRRGRPVDVNGGLFKARAVFAGLPAGSTRQQAIAAFQLITDANGKAMSKGTAAAYYSVINRKSA